MNKTLKKTLGALLSLAMVAGTVVLPATTASAAEVGTTWKFDFGTSENTEADWIAVTKDDSYAGNVSASPVQYGFLGTDGHGDSYAQHIDGVVTKKGQNVTLKAGAKATVVTASDDYLGVDQEETLKACKIEGDYPIRFAMKAESDSYYNVKVKLTTFDQTAAATASLFSERHHAIILEEAIAAGAEKEVEFNTTIQPFYLKDSSTTYNDDMLNVVVVGNNVAVESIVIEKVNPLPTIWMYDDSTGCDYQFVQPFFMLQNYGGTGSFLSKYLPKGIVAVNQGEGGLNAADNQHWGAAKSHIGAGDYVYVQYGHNHKNDATVAPGTLGYLESIPKYYEQAHSVGAYTIYAGPIDRHLWPLNQGNEQMYHVDAINGYHWTATLAGFSKAAKYYTEILITAGKTKADEFVTKARTESPTEVVDNKTQRTGQVRIADSTYEWADEVIAAGIAENCVNGVSDVAFVDLNQPTIDWLEDLTTKIQTLRTANGQTFTGVNIGNASDYYFYSQKGGAVDGTHCNTAGADNTASFFFNEANKTIALASSSSASAAEKTIAAKEAAVLNPLVTGMRTTTDTAYVVPDDIILAGAAPNSAWPTVYVPSSLPALPLVIKDIKFDEDGKVEEATIYRQDAEKTIATYGILDIEIKDSEGTTKGHIYSKQIEPTGTNNATFTYTAADFTTYDPSDLTFEEGDTYTAVVRSASDSGSGLVIDTGEAADTYSAVYEPTDIDTDLMVDNFEYYGVADGAVLASELQNTSVSSELPNGEAWTFVGSSGHTNAVNKNGAMWYTTIQSTGSGSYNLWKNFDVTDPGMTNTGRYMFEADFNYTSGGGSVVRLATGSNNNNRQGSESIVLFKIGANGDVTVGNTTTKAGALTQGEYKSIKAIVDTDLGTLSVSVAGGAAATIDLENYQTTSTTVKPAKLTQIHFGGDSTAYNYTVTNIHIAKLKNQKLPTKTVTVAASDAAKGTVSVSGADSTGVALGYNKDTHIASVKADKAMTVYLIEAKYTGKSLTEAIPTKMEFTEAGTKTQSVTAGSKLMVWKTLEGIEPVTDAITATETVELPSDTSITKPLNTIITVKAAANNGQAFVNWTDGENNIVSSDQEYTFRMRDNINLTANFVKEPGIEDIASYTLTADNVLVKAGTEQKVNISISEPKTADNVNIKATAADATWSCATAGVSVDKGVVTIAADFAIDANTSVDVPINCQLGTVNKTITITVHSYAFYQTFDGMTTASISAKGTPFSGELGAATIENDSTHGNYFKYNLGNTNTRSIKYTFPSEANINGDSITEFDAFFHASNKEAIALTLFDSTGDIAKYMLNLNDGAGYSTTYTVNGITDNTVAIANDNWVHVYVKTYKNDSKADIKITNGATTITDQKNVDITGNGVVGGLNFLSGRYWAVLQLDNIKVYPAN